MLAGIGLPLAGLMLGIAFVGYLRLAAFALRFPFGLDYGEGIVWQQMRSIVAGQGYAPIGVYPSIVFHYPPVFHLTAAATAAIAGIDQLAAGRLVSIVAALASMMLAGLLAASAVPDGVSRRRRAIVAAFTALCPVATSEMVAWSVMMRVDLLAIMLGLAGLLLVVRSHDRPVLTWLAAPIFVLAVFTKQTSVAAPAAAFVALLIAGRRRQAFGLLGGCTALGLAALAVLEARTRGGFLVHVVLYNVNRFDLRLASTLLRREASEAVLLAIAGFGAVAAWRRLREAGWQSLPVRLSDDRRLFALLVLLLFLAIRAAMLPMMLKSGASSNYLVEWVFAVSIFVGLAMLPLIRAAAGNADRAPILLSLLVAIGLPYQVLTRTDFTRPAAVQAREIAQDRMLVAHIRSATDPVVSDDMVLLLRAGRPVMWEPAIEAELATAGRYDERGFARMVRNHAFAFFLTEGDRGTRQYDQRYNQVVADAIDAAYPVKRTIGPLVMHLPRAGPLSDRCASASC